MSPLLTIAKFGYSLISSKSDADALYVRLLPSLRYIIRSKGRHSGEAIALFEILEKLPSAGARRMNFKRHYIEDPKGWESLPDHPKDFQIGFWH